MRGKLNIPYRADTAQEHLGAAVNWLCAAQDGTNDDGVSAFYDVRMGVWCPSYPETTGYIIPTMLDYAELVDSDVLRQRALRMARWLLTLQLELGAFPIGPLWPDWERKPIVFDTGQILFGMVRAYRETNDVQFLEAARRAADWLVSIQDADGAWSKYTSLNIVHTYNVRTAWGLLQVYKTSGDDRYCQAAVRNLEWSVSQQDADGWYRNAGFRPGENPLTHTIAYTVEGLLELGVLLSQSAYIYSAQRAADAMRKLLSRDGFLRARYGSGWSSADNWSCLTGTAQMALVWLRLFEITGEEGYLQDGLAANRYIKQRQPRDIQLKGFYGGIAGSYPIYGDYEPFRHLNWAAKFFVDSLLLEHHLVNRQRQTPDPIQKT